VTAPPRARALIVAALVAFTACDRLADREAERTITRARTDLLAAPELHVVLCGTGSPLPDPARAGACTAVIAGGELVLVDVGPGSWERVDLANLPTTALSAILLTHFHSDHIGDLGEATTQSWIAGRAKPLEVYGPPGVAEVVGGFDRAYAQDRIGRVAHHGADHLPPAAGLAVARELAMPDGDAATPVFERNGLRVTMFRVDHSPVYPAVGYRFDYRGRAVVVSGDTARSASVVEHARGADLLVHEAMQKDLVERASAVARRLGRDRLADMAHDNRLVPHERGGRGRRGTRGRRTASRPDASRARPVECHRAPSLSRGCPVRRRADARCRRHGVHPPAALIFRPIVDSARGARVRHAGVVLLAFVLLTGCAGRTPALRPQVAAPSDLPNVGVVKQQVKDYRVSGHWDQDIAVVAEECTRLAREALARGGRPAVVFDIDETLLSNWPYIIEYDFARVPALFAPWAERSEDAAIEPVKRFYLAMRGAGVATFVMTGRGEPLRAATIRNLERQGISGWEGISFRPQEERDRSIVPFKSGERARIEANGYTIVANIGDQDSGLAGGHSQNACKRPNPSYFIP
jgi:ribonuclease Z